MTKSVIAKSTEPESKDAPDVQVTVDNREVWLPKECPKCERLLKTRKGYENHISKCDKKPSKPRVILSDEERIARRKAGVQAWVAAREVVQVRLLKGSEELAFVNARVKEMRVDNPNAGWATYFMGLLESDMKKYQRKAAKAAK